MTVPEILHYGKLWFIFSVQDLRTTIVRTRYNHRKIYSLLTIKWAVANYKLTTAHYYVVYLSKSLLIHNKRI